MSLRPLPQQRAKPGAVPRKVQRPSLHVRWPTQHSAVLAATMVALSACSPSVGPEWFPLRAGDVAQGNTGTSEVILVMVEGLATQLNPQINMWDVASPYVRSWIRDELGPEAAIADRLRQDPARWRRFDAQGARRWFFKVAHQPEALVDRY